MLHPHAPEIGTPSQRVESGVGKRSDAGAAPSGSPRRVVGDYALVRALGSGSMGEVWLARHAVTHALAAVKLLHPRVATKERIVRFFEGEQRAIARLTHPHIVALFDHGPGYLVTAFVDGHDLARALQTPIEPSVALRYGAQIASALQHAHSRGVVHRDVKPGNILLDRRGNAYLADFGLAAIVDEVNALRELRVGTPEFMAPEQLRGAVSPAADQYALARTILEMLAGGSVALETAEALAAVPASLPRSLVAVLRRAIAHAPEDRWPSMDDFAAALSKVDLGDAAAPIRVAPELRVGQNFRWCVQPMATAEVAPAIMRADYRLSDIERAGVLSAKACSEFREATSQDEMVWSVYCNHQRLGPITDVSALARATDLVVLLHGLFCSRADWEQVAMAVCRDNAQAVVMVPDLLGCGDSRFCPTPRPEHLSSIGAARSILRWLDLLGVRDLSTVLVGHSVSASTVMSIGSDELGERVSRIAITPVFPRGGAIGRASYRAMGLFIGTAIRFPSLRPRIAAKWDARPDLATLTVETRARITESLLRFSPTVLAELFAQLKRAKPVHARELARCLVVVGEDDSMAPAAETLAALAEQGFDLNLVERLVGNGHHPHYENTEHPELTARCIFEIVRYIDAMLISSREGSPLSTRVASTVLEAETSAVG